MGLQSKDGNISVVALHSSSFVEIILGIQEKRKQLSLHYKPKLPALFVQGNPPNICSLFDPPKNGSYFNDLKKRPKRFPCPARSSKPVTGLPQSLFRSATLRCLKRRMFSNDVKLLQWGKRQNGLKRSRNFDLSKC